jgi:phage host-nuclease inhibitor protein Gam
MKERQHNKKLIYIPVIHSGSDMGTIADDISRKGIAELGIETWQSHIRTVDKYWDVIANYCEELKIEINEMNIYQDGMVTDGEIAMRIVEDSVKMGSRNYEIVSNLITRGARIVRTEEYNLVKKELELYKSISTNDSLLKKLLKIIVIKAKRYFLMKKRDAFIAASIDQTLNAGNTGLIFLGAYHHILDKLPEDIEIIQVKEISKVKQYQKLLPFQSKHKALFDEISQYLVAPVTTN